MKLVKYDDLLKSKKLSRRVAYRLSVRQRAVMKPGRVQMFSDQKKEKDNA